MRKYFLVLKDWSEYFTTNKGWWWERRASTSGTLTSARTILVPSWEHSKRGCDVWNLSRGSFHPNHPNLTIPTAVSHFLCFPRTCVVCASWTSSPAVLLEWKGLAPAPTAALSPAIPFQTVLTELNSLGSGSPRNYLGNRRLVQTLQMQIRQVCERHLVSAPGVWERAGTGKLLSTLDWQAGTRTPEMQYLFLETTLNFRWISFLLRPTTRNASTYSLHTVPLFTNKIYLTSFILTKM